MGNFLLFGVDAFHNSSCVHCGRCLQWRSAGKLNYIASHRVETHSYNISVVFSYEFVDYFGFQSCSPSLSLDFFIIPLAIGLAMFGGLGMDVTMVWHLSIVATVTEDECCGLEGMKKTRYLIHGKRTTTRGLLMSLIVIVGLFNFAEFMGNFSFVGIGASLLYAIVYLVLVSVITLMWEVTQSVLFLVCKAHQGDSVEIGGLSLEACPPIVQAVPSSAGNLSLDINNYSAS